MSEQLQTHRTRFDLRHLNEVLHDFLMRLAPAPLVEPAREDIAWEDGEVEDEKDAAAR